MKLAVTLCCHGSVMGKTLCGLLLGTVQAVGAPWLATARSLVCIDCSWDLLYSFPCIWLRKAVAAKVWISLPLSPVNAVECSNKSRVPLTDPPSAHATLMHAAVLHWDLWRSVHWLKETSCLLAHCLGGLSYCLPPPCLSVCLSVSQTICGLGDEKAALTYTECVTFLSLHIFP